MGQGASHKRIGPSWAQFFRGMWHTRAGVNPE